MENVINFNIALIGIIVIWILGIGYCLMKLKERIFLLFFFLAQFVFLMIRPIISMCTGKEWWIYWPEAETFAVNGVGLSLLGLIAGAVAASFLMKDRKKKGQQNVPTISERIKQYENQYRKYIAYLAIVSFGITWLIQMYSGIEKMIFMHGKSYLEYYASYTSTLPYVLLAASSMMKYFLCIYLATKPVKRNATIVIIMYLVTTIPDLIVGIRNPFVLGCIFAFLYYCIRDIMEDKQKWIGRKEVLMTVLAIPLASVLLGIYTYTRTGTEVAVKGLGRLIVNFFYNQGVSFDVLAIGFGAIPYLPQRSFRNYTFGGIIDYFTHGKIGQILLGNVAFPDGNCVVNALERNSLAHNMSYIACGHEQYLAGNGLGSSYILENYIDFGYIGVFLFAMALGCLLVYATKWMKKNMLVFSIILVSLMTIFFTPRAESTGWIEFIFYMQFWLPAIFCFGGAIVVGKVLKRTFLEKK